MYRFNSIPIKNHGKLLFVETDKLILKVIWICKELRIVKTILKEKNEVGGLILPHLIYSYSNQNSVVLASK